jgi:hypothetical protein
MRQLNRRRDMPQLVLLAAVGAGAYAGYRWLRRAAAQMQADFKAAEVEVKEQAGAARAKNLGALEYDPVTGQYRPSPRE